MPWTSLEVHVDGAVYQCCNTWTVGERGRLGADTLEGIWNGAGYRAARRAMADAGGDGLCQSICPRLHDGHFAEDRLPRRPGSPAFVANQELLAREIAERRDVLTARPLMLALMPSSYCNYDCIMCDCGRAPRRDLPATIWHELEGFLPALQTLTLLGGEPLADAGVMRFLREFDRARWPDVCVDLTTNGSLLTEKALGHMTACRFGAVTVSLNAGTPEVYDRVQRGVPFADVLANVDSLVRHRAAHGKFGVTLSFVVQPANAQDLLAFGAIAHARDLDMRLLPLDPHMPPELDYYGDGDEVARVLGHLDEFAAWAARSRPRWAREIAGTRAAIVAEAASRRAAPRRLPMA